MAVEGGAWWQLPAWLLVFVHGSWKRFLRCCLAYVKACWQAGWCRPQQLLQHALNTPTRRRHYRNPAHQRRVRGAWAVAGDCDLLLFLVDAARELQRPDPRIHRLLADSCTAAGLGLGSDEWQPPPAVLVLNKCDAVPRPQRTQLLPLSDRLRQLRQFDDVFFISAKDGEGGCLGGCGLMAGGCRCRRC